MQITFTIVKQQLTIPEIGDGFQLFVKFTYDTIKMEKELTIDCKLDGKVIVVQWHIA